MPDTTEAELWAAYRQDPSPAAEAVLVAHYEPLIRMVCGKKFATIKRTDPDLFEDLKQNARTRLVKLIRDFNPSKGSFSGYANMSLWGEAMKALKAHNRSSADVSLDTPDEDGELRDTADPDGDPLKAAHRSRITQAVKAAEGRIPAKHRDVYRAVTLDGKTRTQAAREFGLRRQEVDEICDRVPALLRQFLARKRGVFTRKQSELKGTSLIPKRRGRPPGKRFSQEVKFDIDPVVREMLLRAATFKGWSEARLMRELIRATYRELRKANPEDRRLQMTPRA